MKSREGGNILIIVVGVGMVLFLIGFFRSEQGFWDSLNYKKIMRLQCGLTVKEPIVKEGVPVEFPIRVSGYINGCGWNRLKDLAGTVQIFDAKGNALGDVTNLSIPADSTQQPYYFEALLTLRSAPTTDTGILLMTSNARLLNPVHISF